MTYIRKILKSAVFFLMAMCLMFAGSVAADRLRLDREVIRLHVVGASDGQRDQEIKLLVRDAIRKSMESDLGNCRNTHEARAYLCGQLEKLEDAANSALRTAGSADTATISFGTEAFPRRVYDTFSLPAGVYQTLRVTIGEGAGRNWWCVVFPQFCTAAVSFQDTAAKADFPESLSGALTGRQGCSVRFYLLEKLGEIENFLFRRK